MSINTDGQKKQGRFLKKNSKILSAVSLVNFNFEEICSHPLVGFDNAERSIIHTKFHDPKELKDVVKQHQTMNEKVHDPSQPQLGVIFPADFTQDWHNERLNSKRRALGFDDEDEIDFAEVARNRGQNGSKQALHNQKAAESKAANLALEKLNSKEIEDSKNLSTKTDSEIDSPQIAAHASDPASLRAPELDGKVVSLDETAMASAINKAFVPHTSKSAVADQQLSQSEFTPLHTEGGHEVIAAEDKAIESWRQSQNLMKQNEQLLDQLKSEAKSEGYQAGFREGEEKGLMSGQKNAAQVFGKVTEILKEFENLKGLILENVQKNFYELSQAIGEALLGREFSIRPESYAIMIQRVIKDTIAPNEFKVRLHPETWQKVHDLGISELEPHLIKDSAMPPGEFRVESALSVIDVNAKKLVHQLLEKADITLFDDKKAS